MEKVVTWRVNTPALLKEILQNNEGMSIMNQPFQIFANILGEVSARCLELDDKELNALMARLALYDLTDPYSKDFNEEATWKLLNKIKSIKELKAEA